MTRVRRATVADAEALAALAARLFFETYEAHTPADDMSAYLADEHTPARRRAELESPTVATFVAEDEFEGDLVGFVQVRAQPLPEGVTGRASVELARLYIDRGFQGRALAAELLGCALDAARTLGATDIWLSVWEQNARAIAFYRKHGFVTLGSHEFVVANSSYTDFVMSRALGAGLEIRRARAADAEPVSQLIAPLTLEFLTEPDGAGAEQFLSSLTAQGIARLIADDAFRYYVAECHTGIVGAAAIRDGSHLYHLFVEQAHHGRGIGRALWERLRIDATAAGHDGAFTVNASVAAVEFYRQFGFRETGRLVERDGVRMMPMRRSPARDG
jgi:ribosomal protein S18 acetylase RimI-like enzyme